MKKKFAERYFQMCSRHQCFLWQGWNHQNEKNCREKWHVVIPCYVSLYAQTCVAVRMTLQEHVKSCHAGTQFLMYKLQKHSWVLKYKKSLHLLLANLPEYSTIIDFEIIGVGIVRPLYLYCFIYLCSLYSRTLRTCVFTIYWSFSSFFADLLQDEKEYFVLSDNDTNFIGADRIFYN